jgi:hypothetical protein
MWNSVHFKLIATLANEWKQNASTAEQRKSAERRTEIEVERDAGVHERYERQQTLATRDIYGLKKIPGWCK